MKPQIFIPLSLLLLCFILPGRNLYASGNKKKEVNIEKTEQTGKMLKHYGTEIDPGATQPKNNRPAKPKQNDNKKDSIPQHESTGKKAHSEEDGKHHHFHMQRAKKVKRFCNLVCFLAKLLLIITHICLLVYVLTSAFSH